MQITLRKEPLPKPEKGAPLGFGVLNTDHIFDVDWEAGKGWGKPRIMPFENFSIHPFNSTLHYALQCFEGMKAYRDPNNHIRTFRPEKNAARMNESMKALCMPTYDEQEFLKCLDELIKIDKDWAPEHPASLYVRPTANSMTNQLGVHEAKKVKLFIAISPSGSYFAKGVKPLKIKVETEGVRAWPGGTGNVKLGANYASSPKFTSKAEKDGFDQIIWMSGKNMAEVGAANFFVLWTNKKGEKELATPKLDGTILPGITRDSVIQLSKEDPKLRVTERLIPIAEVVKASKEKRVIFKNLKSL